MLRAGSRTYFLDIEQERGGGRFVLITESHGQGRERHRIMIWEEYLPAFAELLQEAVQFLRR
jgi:hypothetical protein